jgi:hypothetical protein
MRLCDCRTGRQADACRWNSGNWLPFSSIRLQLSVSCLLLSGSWLLPSTFILLPPAFSYPEALFTHHRPLFSLFLAIHNLPFLLYVVLSV